MLQARSSPSARSILTICAVLGTVALLSMPARAVAGGSSNGSAPSINELAGTTTVDAQGSARVDVELPIPAEIDLSLVGMEARPRGVTVDGPAPFSGVALIRRADGEMKGFLAGLFMDNAIAAQYPYTRQIFPSSTPLPNGILSLPKGTYELHVIAPGPATVTLKIKGLDGTSQISAEDSSSTTVRLLNSRSPASEVLDNVFWVGDNASLPNGGLNLFVIAATYATPVVFDLGYCYYRSNPPADVAYLPGCPLAATHSGSPDNTAFFTNAVYTRSEYLYTNQGPGEYGQGGWFLNAGQVTDVSAVAIWVDTGDPTAH